MSGRSKVSVQPINIIFRHLQQQTRVSLWLYDNVDFRIEGKIIVSISLSTKSLFRMPCALTKEC